MNQGIPHVHIEWRRRKDRKQDIFKQRMSTSDRFYRDASLHLFHHLRVLFVWWTRSVMMNTKEDDEEEKCSMCRLIIEHQNRRRKKDVHQCSIYSSIPLIENSLFHYSNQKHEEEGGKSEMQIDRRSSVCFICLIWICLLIFVESRGDLFSANNFSFLKIGLKLIQSLFSRVHLDLFVVLSSTRC